MIAQDRIVDDRMARLDDRLDECVATPHRERMALELVVRTVGGNDPDTAGEANHVAVGSQANGPGWEALTPQLFLVPVHVCNSIVARAAQGVTE